MTGREQSNSIAARANQSWSASNHRHVALLVVAGKKRGIMSELPFLRSFPPTSLFRCVRCAAVSPAPVSVVLLRGVGCHFSPPALGA